MGKSSSSSATSTSTLNMTSQTDNRLAVGDGGFGITGSNNAATVSNTTNYIDPGALKAMQASMDAAAKAQAEAVAAANAAAAQASAQAARTSSDAFGFATNADASNKNAFSDLMATSYNMFDRSYDVFEAIADKTFGTVADTQALTAQAYQTAEAEKSGSIDNKTIAIIAVAGAAAFVLARKG